jgi:hypothetical protein
VQGKRRESAMSFSFLIGTQLVGKIQLGQETPICAQNIVHQSFSGIWLLSLLSTLGNKFFSTQLLNFKSLIYFKVSEQQRKMNMLFLFIINFLSMLFCRNGGALFLAIFCLETGNLILVEMN